MRRHHELMERLAAADPVRDREELTPDEQREADALLARLLATRVEPQPQRPRARLRRRTLAVAAAACAALAGFAAIDLLDSGPAGPSVVDRAVAAVSRGGVYHVVELITLRDTPETRRDYATESWYTSDGRQHRQTYEVRGGKRGRLVEDFAGRRRAGRTSGAALLWDVSSNTISESGFARGEDAGPDPFSAPGAQLRALEKQGRLRAEGTTTVDGRRAYRLVSEPAGEERIEFTVDAETYLPLTQRVTYGKLVAETRYQTYERVALNDESERRLALGPHPGAKCSEFAHELTEKRDLGFPNPCAGR